MRKIERFWRITFFMVILTFLVILVILLDMMNLVIHFFVFHFVQCKAVFFTVCKSESERHLFTAFCHTSWRLLLEPRHKCNFFSLSLSLPAMLVAWIKLWTVLSRSDERHNANAVLFGDMRCIQCMYCIV